ncbi:MAG: sensor histidine kinase, partial [Thauera sp.]|nr:sensor histidine kinase [Thauera sp.]
MGTPARPEPAAATADRDQPAAASPAHGGSLRRRVLAWLLPPLAALLLINAFFTYRSALDAVNQA